jgi:hypothetical protein
MKFSLSELVSKVTGLEARAEAAFKAELSELKATITGTMTQLQTDLTAALSAKSALETEKATLTASVATLNAQIATQSGLVTEATTALRTHLAKVDSAFAPNGAKAAAPLAELITAEINATNTALAKTGVDVHNLPAAPATTGAGATTAAPKKFASVDEEIAAYKAANAKA